MILSRYPIVFHSHVLLPKPGSKPFWYRLFYLGRYAQRALIELPGSPMESRIDVWNLHLDAYDRENRHEQVEWVRHALRTQTRGQSVVFGGDLNATPPEAVKRSSFPDAPEDDYEGDETVFRFRSLPGWKEAVDPGKIAASPMEWFTFPASSPNRMLDHLFVPAETSVLSSSRPETGVLSDHLPLFIEAEFGLN